MWATWEEEGLESLAFVFPQFSPVVALFLVPYRLHYLLFPYCIMWMRKYGTVITLFVATHTKIEPFAFWKGLGLPSFVVMGVPQLDVVEVVIQV